MNRRLRACTAAACLAATGCYSYVPVTIAAIPPGAHARARLSPAEAVRVGEVLGREDRLLEGQVVEAGGDRLLLAVPVASGTSASGSRQLHQRVLLSREGILEVEQRRLSGWRTGLFVGGGAVLAGVIVGAAFAAAGDSEGQGKVEPERIVIPIFRFD